MKLVKNNGSDAAFGLIGRGVEVSGDVVFTDRLQVEGKVNGKLISESGTLIVEETGQIEAQVDVAICVIRGALDGNVNAKSRVEIHKTSRVHGDMTTPVLLIEEGAVFNGSIGMGQKASGRLTEAVRPNGGEEEIKVKGA